MATTIKVMLNTDRTSASGLYPLTIRVIHNRRKKLIYLGFKFRVIDFDPLAERILWSPTSTFNQSHANEVNRLILSEKQSLERRVVRLYRRSLDGFAIDELLGARVRCKRDSHVFRYGANEILLKRSSRKFGTANLYQSTLNSLKRFTPGGNLYFRDINYRFLCHYICFLEHSGVSTNTIHMYLRNLRSIYNKARKEGVAVGRTNPFNEVRMNVLPTVKRALSKEVIHQIIMLDLSDNTKLDVARDLFLFSFYTRGMSFVDIALLKKSNISGDTIWYSRNKTHQHIQVGITMPVRELLAKYQNDSLYVFPFIHSTDDELSYREYRKLLSSVNLSLKEIARMLNLATPLTTYVARHSWATIAKQEGAPIAAISEGLGHTTEKTTQIYLRAFETHVIDGLNAKIVNLCMGKSILDL